MSRSKMHKVLTAVLLILVSGTLAQDCAIDQVDEEMLKEALATGTDVAFALASTFAPVASPFAQAVLETFVLPDPDSERVDAIEVALDCVIAMLQQLELDLDELKASLQELARKEVENVRLELIELRGQLKIFADRSFQCGNENSPLHTVVNSCTCLKFYDLFARTQELELQAGPTWNTLHSRVLGLLVDYHGMQAMLPVLRASISSYSGVLSAVGLLSESERAWKHRLTACNMVNDTIPGKEFCPSNTCQPETIEEEFQDFVRERFLMPGFDMLSYLVSTAADRLDISDEHVQVDIVCKYPEVPALNNNETQCFVDCKSAAAAGISASSSEDFTRLEECSREYAAAGFPSHPHTLGHIASPPSCSCKWCPYVNHDTLCGTCGGYRTCKQDATLDPFHHKVYQELLPSLNLVAVRINICTCIGGREAVGSACPSYRGQQLCTECYDGFELSSTNACHPITNSSAGTNKSLRTSRKSGSLTVELVVAMIIVIICVFGCLCFPCWLDYRRRFALEEY